MTTIFKTRNFHKDQTYKFFRNLIGFFMSKIVSYPTKVEPLESLKITDL